jgi:hypothetical protein
MIRGRRRAGVGRAPAAGVSRAPAAGVGRVLAAGVAALAGVLAAGCATVPAGGPPDPATEARVVAATAPQQPMQVTFDWNMTDRDARFNGRGVLRVDRGYRARVDLFGPRGETLTAGVVEGEQMRVVPAGSEALLPPPALLWAALGVFRAPTGTVLTSTTAVDGGFILGYARDDAHWTFRFENDALRSTEWTQGRARRTVVLTGTAPMGLPQQAVFRDWTEFRELTLRVTDVEQRTGFDRDVWILPGQF